MRKRASASDDYLLTILSPLDVDEAVRQYVASQPTKSLLSHIRRCAERMDGVERWELAEAFGSKAQRSADPLFDDRGPSVGEIVELAQASSSELHERFILFLQRNRRDVTTLDRGAINRILRPLEQQARAQSEDTTLPETDEQRLPRSMRTQKGLRAAVAAIPLVLVVAGVIVVHGRITHESSIAPTPVVLVPDVVSSVVPHVVPQARAQQPPAEIVGSGVVEVPVSATLAPTAAPLDVAALPSTQKSATAIDVAATQKNEFETLSRPYTGAAPTTVTMPSAQTTSTSAPADEYFGQQRETILAIRNHLNELDMTSDGDMSSHTVAAELDDLQDEVFSWQKRYPNDPWVPRALSRLIKDYGRAGETSSPQAKSAFALMLSTYPSAPETKSLVVPKPGLPSMQVDPDKSNP